MNIEKLCMACMSYRGEANICPLCGKNKNAPADNPQHLPPYTILNGKYLLGSALGQGGFGITYLAWDLNLNIKLAIKEYFPSNLANRNNSTLNVSYNTKAKEEYYQHGLNKFLEEARTIASLEGHPKIVSVKDFFAENGTAYLVMNYLEGMSLKDYMQKNGGIIDFEKALNIIISVLDALEYIHDKKILHRDISPDNIFITEKLHIKILDFGTARHAIGEDEKSLSIILKPGYAPEEQYRSRGKQGPWTDVYAAAATFYHIITGITPPESLDRLHEEILIPPSKLGIKIPSNIEQAVIKALSPKAENRYASALEFKQAMIKASTKEESVKGQIDFKEVIVQKEKEPSLPPEKVVVAYASDNKNYNFTNKTIILIGSFSIVVLLGFIIFLLLISPKTPLNEPDYSISSINDSDSTIIENHNVDTDYNYIDQNEQDDYQETRTRTIDSNAVTLDIYEARDFVGEFLYNYKQGKNSEAKSMVSQNFLISHGDFFDYDVSEFFLYFEIMEVTMVNNECVVYVQETWNSGPDIIVYVVVLENDRLKIDNWYWQ